MKNKMIEKLKALILYSLRIIYFIWNKYFRSDKVKMQNGRIYSKKQIVKQMREYCANQDENFGELSHPQQNRNGYSHTIIDSQLL